MSAHEAERTNGHDGEDDLTDLADLDEPDGLDELDEPEADEPDEAQQLDEADDEFDEADDDELPAGKVHFDADEPLLADAAEYRTRWLSIQTGFVDEPLYAVESAGRLLTEVLGDLASTFAQKRGALERQWRHGGDTSTDDLRAAFKNYRAFFNRVVST